MSNKRIEQTFSLLAENNISIILITASNYNGHVMKIQYNGQSGIPISVDEMRKVAANLIVVANQIENDQDFNLQP